MDYKKLTEASLDEIMRQIREINHVPQSAADVAPQAAQTESAGQPVNIKMDQCAIQSNAELGVLEQYLENAVFGREIGVKKSPMYNQRGLKLKIARIVEKVYLRIAELSNRYVRDFNCLILSSLHVIKERIKVLFKNDLVLWDTLKQVSQENQALREEIQQLRSFAENQVEQVAGENAALRMQISQQATAVEQLKVDIEDASETMLVESRSLYQQIAQQVTVAEQMITELQNKMEQVTAENESLCTRVALQEAEAGQFRTNVESKLEQVSDKSETLLMKAETEQAVEDIRVLALETKGAAEQLDAQIREKIAVLVEHINGQVLKSRELEDKVTETAAVVKWVNNQQFTADVAKQTNADDVLDNPVFYHDFEERFRGTQRDIKERMEVYLPMLCEHFGSFADKRFVDIGCGRGEWLDMIAENGARDYIGIDLNPVQIEICKQKGHPTQLCDAVQYLAGVPDESVDLISGIQIIEHLSVNAFAALLTECHRVLRPNGMILFETPNFANLITATAWFYLDPTHIRPVSKELARFLVERSGYQNVTVLETNPAKYTKTLVKPICFDGNQVVWDENIDTLNNLLYGPQDYAIVGVKGHE